VADELVFEGDVLVDFVGVSELHVEIEDAHTFVAHDLIES
jgi:hypothetical protein